MYLQNILLEGIEKISEMDSRERIKEIAKEIDAAAVKSIANDKKGKLNEESIISDLVNQFMIPEVYKRVARRSMQLKQQRHLLAAHDALFKQIEEMPPIERSLTSAMKVSNAVIEDLITEIASARSSLSEISSDEEVGVHEAKRMIDKIIRNIIPSPKRSRVLQTPGRKAANATITDLLTTAVAPVSTDPKPNVIRRIYQSFNQRDIQTDMDAVKERLQELDVESENQESTDITATDTESDDEYEYDDDDEMEYEIDEF